MALTIAVSPTGDLPRHSIGDRYEATRQITFDNSYPTGGEAVLASDFGMSQITHGYATTLVPGATGINVTVLPQTDGSALLRVMTAAQVEVGNGSDQSALIARVTCKGK